MPLGQAAATVERRGSRARRLVTEPLSLFHQPFEVLQIDFLLVIYRIMCNRPGGNWARNRRRNWLLHRWRLRLGLVFRCRLSSLKEVPPTGRLGLWLLLLSQFVLLSYATIGWSRSRCLVMEMGRRIAILGRRGKQIDGQTGIATAWTADCAWQTSDPEWRRSTARIGQCGGQ